MSATTEDINAGENKKIPTVKEMVKKFKLEKEKTFNIEIENNSVYISKYGDGLHSIIITNAKNIKKISLTTGGFTVAETENKGGDTITMRDFTHDDPFMVYLTHNYVVLNIEGDYKGARLEYSFNLYRPTKYYYPIISQKKYRYVYGAMGQFKNLIIL